MARLKPLKCTFEISCIDLPNGVIYNIKRTYWLFTHNEFAYVTTININIQQQQVALYLFILYLFNLVLQPYTPVLILMTISLFWP